MSNEEVVMDVGYIRCSTAKQELEVQRQKMRDAGVDAVYEDFAESGAKLGREGLEKALAAVREGDRLTVVKVDRLSRSLRDLLELVEGLEKRGVSFRALDQGFDTSTIEGKLLLSILGAVAEFERGIIRARTEDGIKLARSKGRYQGRKPRLSERQQKAVLAQYESGEYTITELAEMWNVSRPVIYRVIEKAKADSAKGVA